MTDAPTTPIETAPTPTAAPQTGTDLMGKAEGAANSVWEWAKGLFSGTNDSLSGLIGGGIGVLGAWIISSMFGGGWLGTICFAMLALGGYIIGNKDLGPMLQGLFGGATPDNGKAAENTPAKEKAPKIDLTSLPATDPAIANEVAKRDANRDAALREADKVREETGGGRTLTRVDNTNIRLDFDNLPSAARSR